MTVIDERSPSGEGGGDRQLRDMMRTPGSTWILRRRLLLGDGVYTSSRRGLRRGPRDIVIGDQTYDRAIAGSKPSNPSVAPSERSTKMMPFSGFCAAL